MRGPSKTKGPQLEGFRVYKRNPKPSKQSALQTRLLCSAKWGLSAVSKAKTSSSLGRPSRSQTGDYCTSYTRVVGRYNRYRGKIK